MASRFDKRIYVLWIVAVGAIGTLALDLLVPAQVDVAGVYVLPMVALVWSGKKRVLYLGAVGCAGLILLGYTLVPARQALPYALVDRLLAIAVLFVFAATMGRRVDTRRELRRQYSRMKRSFDERDSALEALMAQQARLRWRRRYFCNVSSI
jgi:hypothetical protein